MNRLLSPARLLLVALLFAAIGSAAQAQHQSRGRSFWIAFMSNLGSINNEYSDLRLYVAADTPTTVRVVYFGIADTVTVALPLANTTVEIDISQLFGPEVELDMWEEFAPKAIQVLADHDITCYGVNIRSKSSDAWLSLPEDVLTNAYVVLAYPNGYSRFQSFEDYDTPSQFAVVATEDGTTVRIDPSCQLEGRTRDQFTVTLDRGEIYNAQAQLGTRQDVSGTEIKSNKPIAVYAGTRRAAVPLRVGNYRDHLVEQIPPLEVWGREAIITPHFPITSFSTDTAIVRVLAAEDNTEWSIDGVAQPPLMRMIPQERPLLSSMYITAAKPIIVAQFEHSVNADDENNVPFPGDPFMMLVPPTEQFHNDYSFQAISHPEFADYGHFINVVIPTAAISSIRLDGAAVTATWVATPAPGYSYAQIQIAPGSHHMAADAPFGIYSYGFGPANSYGYPGGQLFRQLIHDHTPPDISQRVFCNGADGFAFEAQLTDWGIDSLYSLPASRNVDVSIDQFERGADTVRYRAQLVDPYNDGVLSMKAIDSTGRSRTQTNPIKGFTVRARGTSGARALLLDTLRLFNRGGGCIQLTLENHGAFAQTITKLDFVPQLPAVTIDVTFPMVLGPRTETTITICATGWPDTLLSAQVLIYNECLDRTVAIMPVESGTDTTSPSLTVNGAFCNRDIVLALSDVMGHYSRIATVEVEELENAREIERTPDDATMPSTHVELRLASIDIYRDVVYQVRVTDVAGNSAVYRDTIGGFTVALLDERRDSISERFGRELHVARFAPGLQRCDSITITNYGARTVTLRHIGFAGNTQYSVPPSQLPFVIGPRSERRIQICIDGRVSGTAVDTLVLVDGCGRSDALVIAADVGVLAGEDACDNALMVTSVGASKRTFLTNPHPNPANGSTAAIDVGLHQDAIIALELFDRDGAAVSTVMQNVGLNAGVHRVVFDISELASGTYFCRLRTAAGELHVAKLIVAR